MHKTRIKVTAEQLKDFVQGKILYKELSGGGNNDPDHIEFIGNDDYRISVEDLAEGIKNYQTALKNNKVSIHSFFEYWVLVLYFNLGDLIGLPEMVGQPGEICENLDVGDSYLQGPFFKNEKELGMYVYSALYDMDDDNWLYEEEPEKLELELQDILDVIDSYKENAGKTVSEWKLTKWQKQRFVSKYSGDHDLDDAEPELIALWKKYLDELAAEDDVNAVKIKGYAYYGDDNPVCPCDWEISRDCMLKLMEIAGDDWKAMAANTLGYIYYYGRVNNGVPQYEEAYKYFSLAAFFGYYEAMYKVGDMLMAGKGTPQNKTAAFHLYRFVYNDCYQSFLEDGIGNQFADATLRMGGAYHKGNGVYQNLMTAYGYYMQARIAIDNRMQRSNFFGNTTVSASIRSAISEIRKELGEEVKEKKCRIELGGFMDNIMLKGVSKVHVKVEKKKTETSVTIRRLKNDRWMPEPNVLITLPSISMCKLTPEVRFTAPSAVPIEVRAEETSFIADKVKVKNDEVHFYYKKKMVLSVGRDGWYIKAEREKGSQVMHRFVGICFEPGGRVYDYLCDGMDIKEGDYVMVPSYNGMVKVQAMRVYEQSEADAPLDIVNYKKAEYVKE